MIRSPQVLNLFCSTATNPLSDSSRRRGERAGLKDNSEGLFQVACCMAVLLTEIGEQAWSGSPSSLQDVVLEMHVRHSRKAVSRQ